MKELFGAMAKAFPDIESATKDKTNPAFRSKYADLAAVVEAIKPALIKHGLFFAQLTHEQPGGVCVETVVCHESGEQMSFGKLFVPATKQDAQGYGSALTYARRYSLMAAFGVPAEDDDGNAAAKSKASDDEERQRAEETANMLAKARTALQQADSTEKLNQSWQKIAKHFKDNPKALQPLSLLKDERLQELEPA